MKVVMTGAPDDPEHIARHVRSKVQRKALAGRFKDPADDFRLAIVVDMWLTGFDVPCAHTMYLGKPLAGHNLTHAIARVNRVYGEKPAGLIVDLIGLTDEETAFYDALAENGSAKEVMKSDRLRLMARELAEMVRNMPKLDRTQRETSAPTCGAKYAGCSQCTAIRPTFSEDATQLVLKQVAEYNPQGATETLLAAALAERLWRMAARPRHRKQSLRPWPPRARRQYGGRLLARYGYPPDLSEDATQLVLKQAELSTQYAE